MKILGKQDLYFLSLHILESYTVQDIHGCLNPNSSFGSFSLLNFLILKFKLKLWKI